MVCTRCWEKHSQSKRVPDWLLAMKSNLMVCPNELPHEYRGGVTRMSEPPPYWCPARDAHEALLTAKKDIPKRVKSELNKEVCKQCAWKERPREWTDFDEHVWQTMGKVLCSEGGQLLSIDNAGFGKIPEWCPYFLEHTLSGNRTGIFSRVKRTLKNLL